MSDDNMGYVFVTPIQCQCTEGHEWEREYGSPGFWTLAFGGEGLEIKDLCPFCLKERIEELLAGVGRRVDMDKEPALVFKRSVAEDDEWPHDLTDGVPDEFRIASD